MAMQVLQLTKLKLDVIQIINTDNTLLQLSQQQKPQITSKNDNNLCQLNLSPYSKEPAL